jgi:hypothetical protein
MQELPALGEASVQEESNVGRWRRHGANLTAAALVPMSERPFPCNIGLDDVAEAA